jgi:hypothetical protein
MWAVIKLGIINSMLCIRVNDKIGDDRYSTASARVTDETGYYRQHPLYKDN